MLFSFLTIGGNVAMQILVADFGDRQRPVGHDDHARIRGWMPHKPRYKICMVLWCVYLFFFGICPTVLLPFTVTYFKI